MKSFLFILLLMGLPILLNSTEYSNGRVEFLEVAPHEKCDQWATCIKGGIVALHWLSHYSKIEKSCFSRLGHDENILHLSRW